MRTLLIGSVMLALSGTAAFADPPPPRNGKPLSEILQDIEAKVDFGYFDEVEWDDGVYEIEFYTTSGSKKKIYIDPVSGAQKL